MYATYYVQLKASYTQKHVPKSFIIKQIKNSNKKYLKTVKIWGFNFLPLYQEISGKMKV